VLTLNSKYTLV